MLTHFPFWAIYRDSQCVANPSTPKHALTFSSAAKAAEFMQQHGITDWEFLVINRFNAPHFIADLRKQGFSGVCFNPDSDGNGQQLAIPDQLD